MSISPKHMRKKTIPMDVITFNVDSSQDILGAIFAAHDKQKREQVTTEKSLNKRYRPTRPSGTPAQTPPRPVIKVTKTDATTRLMNERAIATKHHTEE